MKGKSLAIAAMFGMVFMVGFVTMFTGPLAAVVKAQFGASNALSQFGAAANFIAYLFMGLPCGLMLKRRGYRFTSLAALATGALGVGLQILAGFAASFAIYVAGAFVAGLSMCMLNTTANPLLNTLGGGGNGGNRLVQYGCTFNSAGGMASPLIIGFLIGNEISKANVLDALPVQIAALVFFAFGFAVIYKADIPEPHLERDAPSPWRDVAAAFKFRHFALGALAMFLFEPVECGICNMVNLYLTAEGTPAYSGAVVGGAMVSAYCAFMMAGRFGAGVFGKRVTPRVMVSAAALVCIVLLAAAACVPFVRVAIPFTTVTLPLSAILMTLCGLGISVMFGGIFNLATEGLGRLVPVASGITMSLVSGGALLALVGLVADGFGILSSCWVFALFLGYILFFALSGSRTAAVSCGVLAACAVSAAHAGEELHGVDTWAGIKPLPAVVNGVGCEASANLISLRGEWECVAQPKPFPRRYLHTRVPFAQADETTPRERVFSVDAPWSKARKIYVPGAWEAQGVGEEGMSKPWDALWDSSPKMLRHVYMGELWYRKSVALPAEWAGKKVWLKIGGVKSQGWFWVNGNPVAWVDNYCGTYKYDITPFVKLGATNRVIACVNNALPSRKGLMSNVHRWGGIYRDVEIEATGATRIDDAWVRGDFDATCAEAHVIVAGLAANAFRVRVTVEGAVAESPASEEGETVVRLPLRDFRPWSPEHPNLYWARIELLDETGAVVDTRRERFGVRKLEVRGGEFYLNGHPYFLRGFGDDSVYPLTGLPPADRESHLAHLKKARAAGFNFVRLHTHCEVPEYFEAADEAGIFVQAELPYYTDIPAEAFAFDPLRDLRELYAHYRRHPSFAVYCGGNEGRLGPYVEKKMYEFVKTVDPDRLALHQDGDRPCWLECGGDDGCNDPGNSDFDSGPRNVWPRGSLNPGRPFVCHEYLNLCVKQDTRLEPLYTGAWLAPDSREERAAWLAARGLDMEWGDALQDAQHALQAVYQKRGIESARKDPYCDGYCFWTIVDVAVANGAIHSAQGLFDPFWQTKKGGLSPEAFAMFNSASALLADFSPDCPVAAAGEKREVAFFFANYDGAPKRDAILRWRLVADGATLLEGTERLAGIPEGNARPVAAVSFTVPPVGKAVKAVLHAELDGTANEWDLWLFPERVKRDCGRIAADSSLLPQLSRLYSDVVDAASPAAGDARVVVAPYGSRTAAEALARGKNLLTISGGDGRPNVSLGWWSMGSQVGTALSRTSRTLARLPHEGAMTPLLFRLVKEGAHPLSDGRLDVAEPIIVGEGKKDCYLYLGEINAAPSRHIAAFGLDLLSGKPESTALLDGILEELATSTKGTS